MVALRAHNSVVVGSIPTPAPMPFAVRVAAADRRTASGRVVMRDLMERALVIASTSESRVMPVSADELRRAEELGFRYLAGLRLVPNFGEAVIGADAIESRIRPGVAVSPLNFSQRKP